MGQPRIIEVDYQLFLQALRRATDTGKKIDPIDKEQWERFVRKHGIPEAGMAVKARSGAMSGKTKLVIIEGAGKDDGYYIYSPGDLFCLKYDLGLD
jgi:hypothetical protein